MKRLLSMVAALVMAAAFHAAPAESAPTLNKDGHNNVLILGIDSNGDVTAGVIDTVIVDISEAEWFHDGNGALGTGMVAPYKLVIWQGTGDSTEVTIDVAWWNPEDKEYFYLAEEAAETFSGDSIDHNRALDRITGYISVIIENNDSTNHSYYLQLVFIRDKEPRR